MKKEIRPYVLRTTVLILCITALLTYVSQNTTVFSKTTMASYNVTQNRLLPIYCVETEEKKVALSFDAAWGNEDLRQILKILEANDVKATFFMTGEWVEKYPESVKRMAEEGHELGNHSENHKNMSKLSDAENLEELMKVHEKVKTITGIEMKLFRPPYGDYDDGLIKLINANNYYPIQWSVDTLVI